MQQLHQYREESETAENDQSGMGLNPSFDFRGHECKVFSAFDKKKINNRCGADASKNPDFPFEIAPVIEGEYHSGEKLHHSSEEKRYRYRKEYSEYYRQGFFGVQQVVETEVDTTGHFYQSHYKCSSEKLEHHWNGGGGRHTQRIENIEQYDVGHHHRHEDADEVIEREMLRSEYTMPGNIHHPVAHRRPDKYSDRGDYQHSLERCRPRTYRGVQEIDSIVAYPHRQVEHRQQEQKNHYTEEQYFHCFLKLLFSVQSNRENISWIFQNL